MQEVFSIIFPLFGLVLLGFLFGKTKLLGGGNAKALNDYVYYIALPVLLFYQTAKSPLSALLNYPFILTVLFSNIAILIISFFAGKILFKHSIKYASAYAFSASFSNVGFMGIPLLIAALGEKGILPAILMAIVGNTVVIGLVVILLEAGGKSVNSITEILQHSILSLLKNTMVIGSALGILVAWSELSMPLAVNNLLSMISQSAAPVALFSIGLSMVGLGIKIKLSELVSITLLKLIVFPLITLFLVSYIFPLEKEWAASAILLSALPTGTVVYIVCQKYDLYVKESSSVFLVTTLLSVVTLPPLLYIYL